MHSGGIDLVRLGSYSCESFSIVSSGSIIILSLPVNRIHFFLSIIISEVPSKMMTMTIHIPSAVRNHYDWTTLEANENIMRALCSRKNLITNDHDYIKEQNLNTPRAKMIIGLRKIGDRRRICRSALKKFIAAILRASCWNRAPRISYTQMWTSTIIWWVLSLLVVVVFVWCATISVIDCQPGAINHQSWWKRRVESGEE